MEVFEHAQEIEHDQVCNTNENECNWSQGLVRSVQMK
jgi:hypothetical protein